MKIFSPAFDNARDIPKRYTQEGENISPPLEWTDLPASTKELALICEDPDSPKITPYIHWVIYNVDPQVEAIIEGVNPQTEPSNLTGATQGSNSSGTVGYVGPLPPHGHGWHRYYFRLFALDEKLNLQAGLSAEQLLDRIRNHVIAEAETMGRYQRPNEEIPQQTV